MLGISQSMLLYCSYINVCVSYLYVKALPRSLSSVLKSLSDSQFDKLSDLDLFRCWWCCLVTASSRGISCWWWRRLLHPTSDNCGDSGNMLSVFVLKETTWTPDASAVYWLLNATSTSISPEKELSENVSESSQSKYRLWKQLIKLNYNLLLLICFSWMYWRIYIKYSL